MQQEIMEIRRFMRERQLSQSELADAAGVSQSTVCRCLVKAGERRGAARAKLIRYVRAAQGQAQAFEASHDLRGIMSAARRAWNGTDAHAQLIIKVLSSLANNSKV